MEGKNCGGISGLSLHILAMALMLCDHMWATVVSGNDWMTCVGRMAFPIFAFLLVEGFFHTRNLKRYGLRLLMFAILSEIPFDLMYGNSVVYPFHQNVGWTLLLILLCIAGIDFVRRQGKWWLTLLAVPGISLLGWTIGMIAMVDYFGAGVLTGIVFYLFRGSRWWQRLGQLAGLAWINHVLLAGRILSFTIAGLTVEFSQQGFALLALIPIWLYHGRQGSHNWTIRLACYLFYPVHMLILAMLVRYWP